MMHNDVVLYPRRKPPNFAEGLLGNVGAKGSTRALLLCCISGMQKPLHARIIRVMLHSRPDRSAMPFLIIEHTLPTVPHDLNLFPLPAMMTPRHGVCRAIVPEGLVEGKA